MARLSADIGVCCAVLLSLLRVALGRNDCAWAKGRLLCLKDQKKVIDATVTLYDLDGPKWFPLVDGLDPDDKMGFDIVFEEDGKFSIQGCGSDTDFLFITNQIEPYFHIHHFCNSEEGEVKRVYPSSFVFVPETYHHPEDIILDD